MKTPILLTSALILSLASAPLYARHGHDDYYNDGNVFYDKAKVINVKPMMEVVQVPVSSRECWTDEVEYQGRRSNPNAGMVAGGIIAVFLATSLGRAIGIAVSPPWPAPFSAAPSVVMWQASNKPSPMSPRSEPVVQPINIMKKNACRLSGNLPLSRPYLYPRNGATTGQVCSRPGGPGSPGLIRWGR